MPDRTPTPSVPPAANRLEQDPATGRLVGYAVIAYCDHPACGHQISRGLDYRCGDLGALGCGLFFCPEHLAWVDERGNGGTWLCVRCQYGAVAFEAKADLHGWVERLLGDPAWRTWRTEHPALVESLQAGEGP